MNSFVSAVKAIVLGGALACAPLMATPISIDWTGTPYEGNGTSPIHLQNLNNVEVFEFNGDISGVSQVSQFDGVADPSDYGVSQQKGETLFVSSDPDGGTKDWFLQADFSNPQIGDGVSISLKSNWYCEFSLFDPCSFGDLLIDTELFQLNISSQVTNYGDGDDLLYTGLVNNVNSALDPFGFSGREVEFSLIQGAEVDGQTVDFTGNALLSFNIVEVPEPGTSYIAFMLAAFVLMFKTKKRQR
ncbi:hypothetical protein DS2_04705 [Catenovulum agarivorans DS-2]|uniref:PEP-CTERM protein-sorting domain-containing protein n=1 Tax=Catenovulum agarivorans DS-2 TaxID=1328313 RepID=W7QTE4_9ALTE|nr:hypothetical protein [Catenovulum agarivorans]EWH11128.1 hypothetical protein DS2_04705 [Catenovulum agarivorans DS-2]